MNMQNFKDLSDDSLLKSVRELCAREREITLQILHHLREVERRRLHATLGYSSLHAYCVSELLLSEGAAHRRIASMRLLKELPEIERKVESGELNLSVLSQVQSFLRVEPSKSTEQKLELISSLEGKSSREVERELVKQSVNPMQLKPEKIRPLSGSHSQVSFTADQGLLDQISELRDLLAHVKDGMSVVDVIRYALTDTIRRKKPAPPKPMSAAPTPKSEVSAADSSQPPTSEVPATKSEQLATSRVASKVVEWKRQEYIPVSVKREVWRRDRGCCDYVHEASGRKCSARYRLQYDHIRPRALGGKATVENLRLRCRTHNQLAAIQVFGREKMSRYMSGLR